MSTAIKVPKKLIEVALPLDAINAASAREKSIRHGHPSTLHLWWARRPLAAARAVVFAQMVNDPGFERTLGRGVNKENAAKERERLFDIMRRLVCWEGTTDQVVLKEAKEEIWKSWRETCQINKDHINARELFNPNILPGFHDPFAGGGAIPLEAQRLGLDAYASDLNPVAVTINKAMIEIPGRFAGFKPVGPPIAEGAGQNIFENPFGVSGLAEDIRRYGKWIREEAYKRIGSLYPTVLVTKELAVDRDDLVNLVGKSLPVIAWIWARTVKSPNPAYSHVHVPLSSTFVLLSKENRAAYVSPKINGDQYSFSVVLGQAPIEAVNGTKLARGANFRCLLSGSPIEPDYIKAQGMSGNIGSRLLAVVAESPNGRVYLSPSPEHEAMAKSAKPSWRPDLKLPNDPRNFWAASYGLTRFGDLFTERQLVALNTFSDLIIEAIEKCRLAAISSGLSDDKISLEQGGLGATAYSQAVGVYLACTNSKAANMWSSLCFWMNDRGAMRETFARQTLPMIWDYAEANPFSDSGGSYLHFLDKVVMALEFVPAVGVGKAAQADAAEQNISNLKVVSTDPPYYDNIAYSDLSDFFYVWLRRSIRSIYPTLYKEQEVPKPQELVASPYRHGGKDRAEVFFLKGMTGAMTALSTQAHPAFPVTIYYAFKQSETKSTGGTSSTGWETFLEAVIKSGFSITGTWPVRTEQSAALKATVNALASSIVLVCHRREPGAPSISRRDFVRELNSNLPIALDIMTSGAEKAPVAPVDLSQAIIGPGMAIFSKYSAVLEADGKSMSVRTALQLINRFLAEDDFDYNTQFCINWFRENGWDNGKFGEADVLARAKGTSVEALKDCGILESGAGWVKLIRASNLSEVWQPENNSRISIWEILHHMIRRLIKNGESGAGEILSRVSQHSESIRTLSYRLYTLCERKGWAPDSSQYDQLVRAWDGIEAAARSTGYTGTQISLFPEEQSVQPGSVTIKKKTRKKKT